MCLFTFDIFKHQLHNLPFKNEVRICFYTQDVTISVQLTSSVNTLSAPMVAATATVGPMEKLPATTHPAVSTRCC